MGRRNQYAAVAWQRKGGPHQDKRDETKVGVPLISDDFADAVMTRMLQGRAEYGDVSFRSDPADLIDEIDQEGLDQVGWGYILWRSVRGDAGGDPLRFVGEYLTLVCHKTVHPQPEQMTLSAYAVWVGACGYRCWLGSRRVREWMSRRS